MLYRAIVFAALALIRDVSGTDGHGDPLEKLRLSNVEFAVNLYSEIIKDSKVSNVVFSPVSVAAALAMTKLGSKGNSSNQIAKALLIEDLESQLLNSAFGELNSILFDKPKDNVTLKAANGAFISKSVSVLKDYKNALSVFGADIEELDFGDAAGSVEFINQWISEKTESLIPKMLGEGAVNPDTALLLASTLYFSGDWHSGFIPMHTENRPFYVSHYRVVDTPFMYQKGKFRFGYVESLTLQILEMPYVNQEISMIAMLPDNFDIKTVEKNLNYENMTKWLSNLAYTTVDVTFPRFKIEESVELQKALQGLGITDIFQRGIADLSGISGDKSLFVDAVLHKGVLEVTEEGSKAAAATTVRIMARSIEHGVRFMADHPFLWLIRHDKSGQILFIGRLTKPEGEEMAHDEL